MTETSSKICPACKGKGEVPIYFPSPGRTEMMSCIWCDDGVMTPEQEAQYRQYRSLENAVTRR